MLGNRGVSHHEKFTPLPTYDPDGDVCWNPLDYLRGSSDEDRPEISIPEIESLGKKAVAILDRQDLLPSLPVESIHGMEVGDDRVDVTLNATGIALEFVIQEEIFGMKTSHEDTFISKDVWNFCEVSSVLPATTEGSFDKCRRGGTFEDLEYVDTIVLRIILDVSKNDSSHSSSANGKAEMLGSRLSTPRSELRGSLMLASWVQDMCLSTYRSTDPKYLPKVLGGSGVRALFDNPTNILLYTRAYRGGGYDRLYGSATREVQECLAHFERGQASTPILAYKLRDRQEYLHGTYAEKILVPPTSLRDGKGIPDPLYNAHSGQNRFKSFENRLLRTRLVVGRRGAETEIERSRRIRSVLRGWQTVPKLNDISKTESKLCRQNFERALNANSEFKRLLDRSGSMDDVYSLIKEGFTPVNTGVQKFRMSDAVWIFHGCRSETFAADDLSRTEDIFVREEVSIEESLKVGGIHLLPVIGRKVKPTTTVTRVGLYQINSSMYDWAENLLSRILSHRDTFKVIPSEILLQEFSKDPEWVNDDTSLIGRAIVDTANLNERFSVFLVSGDHRLGNQMSAQANIRVYRFDPFDLVRKELRESYSSTTQFGWEELASLNYLTRQSVKRPHAVYVDTGSLAAAASRLSREVLDDGTQSVFIREHVSAGIDNSGSRVSCVRLRPITRDEVRVTIHDPNPNPKHARLDRPVRHVYRTPSKYARSSWTTASSQRESWR